MASREQRLDLGWDLLDQGEYDGAVEAGEALLLEEPGDPEAMLLVGSALLEAGRRDQAIDVLRRAADQDAGLAPAHLGLAAAFYETCRFGEAAASVDRALDLDPEDPYGHYLKGLILDMNGRRREADACFAEAARRDPDRYRAPVSTDRATFDEAVQKALAALPAEYRDRVAGLPIIVDDVPSMELLMMLEDPDPDLLGLFVGTPITHKSHADATALPDTIHLFRRSLERACGSVEELVEEIRVTLYHEIGHYLGLEEDDLDEAGYA